MNKIDIKGWKNFHLYDEHMFNIDMGNKFDKSKMDTTKNDINFIGRTGSNNGINATCGIYNNIEPYKPGLLTLALGGSVGSCFIQKKSFYTSQNVIVLIPKDNISDNVKQFIATVIQKESELHYKAFVKELNAHIKTDFVIPLPVNADNEPDWEYMESYMKNIMEETEWNIKNLQNISVLKMGIQTEKWGSFKCSKLFTARNTGNILARTVENGSGNTPYVTASGINNGVFAYIDASKYDIIKGHCILIGGKTFTVTYQADNFVSNDSHNFVIRTIEDNISDLSYKYLVAVIRSYFGQKYSWNDAVTKEKFLNENISLPAKTNGQPDWEYMENYMKNIMDDAKAKLNILKTAI